MINNNRILIPMESTDTTILLTVQELADKLRVSESTIYRLVKDNKIPCIRIGKQLRFNLKKVKEVNEKKV